MDISNAVLKIMRVVTPSLISTMSKSIKDEERISLSSMIAQDFKKKGLVEVPEEEAEGQNQEKEQKAAEEKKIALVPEIDPEKVDLSMESAKLAVASGNYLDDEEARRLKESMKKEGDESTSNVDFFLLEQKKGQMIQRKLKFKQILALYESEKKFDVVESSDEFFADKASKGTLVNKRRY